MIFFDNSFVDYSLRTRLSRQIDEIKYLIEAAKRRIKSITDAIGSYCFHLRKKIKFQTKKSEVLYDQEAWKAAAIENNSGVCKKNSSGEDLTIDGYINKHGGIESSIDGKIYSSKSSYMDHIKANGCEIKDW